MWVGGGDGCGWVVGSDGVGGGWWGWTGWVVGGGVGRGGWWCASDGRMVRTTNSYSDNLCIGVIRTATKLQLFKLNNNFNL